MASEAQLDNLRKLVETEEESLKVQKDILSLLLNRDKESGGSLLHGAVGFALGHGGSPIASPSAKDLARAQKEASLTSSPTVPPALPTVAPPIISSPPLSAGQKIFEQERTRFQKNVSKSIETMQMGPTYAPQMPDTTGVQGSSGMGRSPVFPGLLMAGPAMAGYGKRFAGAVGGYFGGEGGERNALLGAAGFATGVGAGIGLYNHFSKDEAHVGDALSMWRQQFIHNSEFVSSFGTRLANNFGIDLAPGGNRAGVPEQGLNHRLDIGRHAENIRHREAQKTAVGNGP